MYNFLINSEREFNAVLKFYRSKGYEWPKPNSYDYKSFKNFNAKYLRTEEDHTIYYGSSNSPYYATAKPYKNFQDYANLWKEDSIVNSVERG